MAPIELIVSGSVAMTENGERVGKGEGYSDLEFAILREFGLVDDETTTVTTVHEIQVVDEEIPTTPQDVPIDWIFTPERTIRTEVPVDKSAGIEWSVLSEDRLDEIPILRRIEQT
jgi:5-formyltetrahydrofolate cyclo-ligase